MLDIYRLSMQIIREYNEGEIGFPKAYWKQDAIHYIKAIIIVRYIFEVQLNINAEKYVVTKVFRQYGLTPLVHHLFRKSNRLTMAFCCPSHFYLSPSEEVKFQDFFESPQIKDVNIIIDNLEINIYKHPITRDGFTNENAKLPVGELQLGYSCQDILGIYINVLTKISSWPYRYWHEISDPLFAAKVITIFMVRYLMRISDTTLLVQVKGTDFRKQKLLTMLNCIFDGNYKFAMKNAFSEQYQLNKADTLKYEKWLREFENSSLNTVKKISTHKHDFDLDAYTENRQNDLASTLNSIDRYLSGNPYAPDQIPYYLSTKDLNKKYEMTSMIGFQRDMSYFLNLEMPKVFNKIDRLVMVIDSKKILIMPYICEKCSATNNLTVLQSHSVLCQRCRNIQAGNIDHGS